MNRERTRRRPFLIGFAAVLASVLGISGPARAAQFTQIGIRPDASGTLNTLHDITSGPDGALWFTVIKTTPGLAPIGGAIGRVTTTGIVRLFSLEPGIIPGRITSGPDGNLWFTAPEANLIGQITTSGAVTTFPVTTSDSLPTGITAGSDGNLWFTETGASQIGQIAADGTITEFPLPTADQSPVAITAGSDGNLWFTEAAGNQIGRITTAGTVTEFAIPTGASNPQGIAPGPDGNLWFTEMDGNMIGRVTTLGVVTEFSVPTENSGPAEITAAPDGNLWFTEFNASKVARLTPSGTFTEYSTPNTNSEPFGITAGADGNIWFAELLRIGKLLIASTLPGTLRGLPPLVDFGTSHGHNRIHFRELRIRNSGPSPATIGALTLSGGAEFSIGIPARPFPTLPLTLQPGQTLILIMVFKPGQQTGDRFGKLTVTSDAQNSGLVVKLRAHYDK